MMTTQKEKKEQPFCPFCDEEMVETSLSYCQACQVTMFYCPECRKSLSRDNKVCPHCGAEIKTKTE